MVKYIEIKEFREKGYLQEANRLFFHPLGLALEIQIDDDGNEKLGGIWDNREDAEGNYYDISNSDNIRIDKFIKNAQFVENEFEKRKKNREVLFGSYIEPIK